FSCGSLRLLYASVVNVLAELDLAALDKVPLGVEAVVREQPKRRVMHVPGLGADVCSACECEAQFARTGIKSLRHQVRLVSRHAIVNSASTPACRHRDDTR